MGGATLALTENIVSKGPENIINSDFSTKTFYIVYRNVDLNAHSIPVPWEFSRDDDSQVLLSCFSALTTFS